MGSYEPYPDADGGLSGQAMAAMAASMDATGEPTSFDDLFDDAAYRHAQTTFHGQGHQMMPHGQTYYRGAVQTPAQGIGPDEETRHRSSDSSASRGPAQWSGNARSGYRFAG